MNRRKFISESKYIFVFDRMFIEISIFHDFLEKCLSFIGAKHLIGDIRNFCMDVGMCLAMGTMNFEIDDMFSDSYNTHRRFIYFSLAVLAHVLWNGCFDDVFEKNIEHNVW